MKNLVRKLFVCLLACMLMVPAFTATASAANTRNSKDIVTVYVNDVKVTGITAYIGNDNCVYVDSEQDLAKVFPAEIESCLVIPSAMGYPLKLVADSLDYLYFQTGNLVYLSKYSDGNNGRPGISFDVTGDGYEYEDEIVFDISELFSDSSEDDTHELSILTLDEDDAISQISDEDVEVFVNGMRVDATSAFLASNGIAYIDDNSDLHRLFPNETKNSFFSTDKEANTIKSWAERFGYTCLQNANRVYLNNDGKSPIEVVMDDSHVDFVDQQPVIVPPGRTMVPIRTIAEMLNCNVTWDGEHNRVVIQSDKMAMVLWIDNQIFWVNGTYYKMDVAPYILNDRIMVPLRFISEAFGYTVTFDSSGIVDVVSLSSK